MTIDRPKDWVDIGHMLEHRPLDGAYVQRWFRHLRGEHGWPVIRRFLDLCDEARPGSG